VRAGTIKVIQGEASRTPQWPAMVKSRLVNQYPLCYIYRSPNTQSFNQSYITNAVGTSGCPYITGILQTQNIDNVVAQWTSQFNDWNNISYLGMLTYNYANRFIIDGSIRREGSSKFAEGHRFGTFWSVGGAYNMHKDFLSSVFNELKLRASYGLTGNSGVSLNQYQQLLGFDADYDNTGAVYPKTLGNPKLTWEKNRTFDVGLNFALFIIE